jgi:N utilization substance protein B
LLFRFGREEKPVNRHQKRERALFAVYQNRILARDVQELLDDNFPFVDREEDPYMTSVVKQAIAQTDRYRSYIDRVLDTWSFERLGAIEQAILLSGCAEFDLKQELAAVIINEYVSFAKKYCDPDAYKMINGVLDRI